MKPWHLHLIASVSTFVFSLAAYKIIIGNGVETDEEFGQYLVALAILELIVNTIVAAYNKNTNNHAEQ